MSDSILPPSGEAILPILPLRNSVLFPASVVPVNVGRARSVRLIEEVFGTDRPTVGVVAQRDPGLEDPEFGDIHDIGTVARVLKVIRLSSGNYSVVLQGVARIRILGAAERHPCLRGRVERLHDLVARGVEIEALTAHLREAARKLSTLVPNQAREANAVLENVRDAGALADLIASNLAVGTDAKQGVLEELDVRERLRRVLSLVSRQAEVFRVKKEISTMVQEEMSRSQREYLLRRQLKALRKELGDGEDEEDEIEELRERIASAELPPEAEKAARKQLSRMSSMSSSSAEYQVTRNYIEWLAELPWSKTTPDRLDVAEARRVLDEDHHGLEKIKQRIVEYIAVRKLRRDKRGPILCFVGPPGVGKTSLARSIARSTGREFVRVSLGGVHDEAEIRGHRRTYVGAYPGRIVSGLRKARSRNPVMLLDEVDKMGRDHQGDPGSALLEVLDPEQNSAFVDHYIEVPVDLSQVLFIATANRKDTIPGPLLDRMEVIDLVGYTREEKLQIARDFLVPRQLSEHGLTPEHLEVLDEAIDAMIECYTREAGVRQLEQRIAALCREVALRFADERAEHVEARRPFVEEVLGPPRHDPPTVDKITQPGVSVGLAWTPAGGDLLYIESTKMPGSGQIHLTGRMGEVMKESVAAAFTYLRARAESLGLPVDFLTKIDVHLHLPQGSIPKDGPSAGIAIFTSLASMLTRIPSRDDVAMTGEISLRGAVLKVGGIKEKCLAAHRAGIKHVILPARNEPDLDDVPADVRKDLEFHFVHKVSEVLPLALRLPSDSAGAPSVALQ